MRAVGIILAAKSSKALAPLTDHRSTSSVPIAGAFRALDFPISNMSNSGIKEIAILSQANTKSLYDHLRSGKWWDIGRKKEGLFVLSPVMNAEWNNSYKGSADAIYQNLDFLENCYDDYVVITTGDNISKIDYRDVIEHHKNSKADITIVTQKNTRGLNMRELGNVVMDTSGRVINFEEKPIDPISDVYFTGVYVLRRELLIELIKRLNSEHRYRLKEDLIIRYRNHLNIQCYDFKGYWNSINTVEAFFRTNMDFLDLDIRNRLFRDKPSIRTKARDLPPVKYNFNATVKNSIVGRGSIIDGAVVDSVVFRDVRVGANSTVKNCIVMDLVVIGENCHLENVIIDKNCCFDNGVVHVGELEKIHVYKKGVHITTQDI